MEENIKNLWQLCLWFFGISTTITLFLFGWIMRIHTRISIGETIEKDIKKMAGDVDEIKIALKGDYDKKGLFTKYYDLEKRVDEIERGNNKKAH